MLLALTWTTAWALPPNHTVRLWPVDPGSVGAIERMAVGVDGDVVVGRVRDTLKGWILDVDAWEIRTFSDCEVTGVAPIRLPDGTDEVWMACSDGTVRGKSWDTDALTLTDVTDESGQPVVLSVDDSLAGLWYYVDPISNIAMLYALTNATGELDTLHAVDPFLLAVDGLSLYPSYPKTLPYDGFNEAQIAQNLLIVSHGGNDMSYLQLGVDSAVGIASPFLGAAGCDDMYPIPQDDGVFCVAAVEGDPKALGAAFKFLPQTGGFTALQLGELINPNAICANPDLNDGWLAVTGTQVKVWEMDTNGGIPNTTPYFEGPEDAENPIQDMETSDGYLWGGGEGGNLHVVTARPWVYPAETSATPSSAADGDEIALSFKVDSDCDWDVYLGGTRKELGLKLASGTADAEVQQSVTLTVDDAWAEGDNHVYIVATDDDNLTGHDRATIAVDNPPDPPKLVAGNLLFGDNSLILEFDGITDEDLSKYDVYVSQTPFTAADYPTGGPPFDGTTKLTTPIAIPSSPGAHVSQRIYPLENEVTYWVAVRATDTGGKVGPMSRVLSQTPHATLSLAEYVGDPGGSPCSTGPVGGGWLGALGVGALALTRRRAGRRLAAAAVATAALAAAAAPGVARAQNREDDPWWRQDMTPSRGNFEVRYGVISMLDENYRKFYTEGPANLLEIEAGPQFFRVAEVDIGMGFFQELSYQRVEGDLDVSPGERTMLTQFPFAISLVGRAHILDEQPAVPFVGYGWDYVLWSEKWDNDVGTKDSLTGAKFGTHLSLGVDLLLDLIQPGRASFLEAQTGINDSWLTLEWRRQRIDARSRPWSGRTVEPDRLDFSGDAFLLGLKLDW